MDVSHAAAACSRAERHSQLRGREDKSDVKCQYAISQISQPDETQE